MHIDDKQQLNDCEAQMTVLRQIMDKRWSVLATLAAHDRGDWKSGDPLIERPGGGTGKATSTPVSR